MVSVGTFDEKTSARQCIFYVTSRRKLDKFLFQGQIQNFHFSVGIYGARKRAEAPIKT